MKRPPYVGRFAPSPSGPLHFGSVIAALASYLCARAEGGQWLIRIDDIDPPRERPGAVAAILRDLERLGLHWDREIIFQSKRFDIYRAVCEQLLASGRAYRCACSRKHLTDGTYPGTCRRRNLGPREAHAVRLEVDAEPICIGDQLQGPYVQNLAESGGDFVIWRTEDLPAYHLACVLDDCAAGVTEVVRGADLLESTPRQYYLQSILDLPHPTYFHLPLAVDAAGQKLSKQTGADALTDLDPAALIRRTLSFLGHPVPPALARAPIQELLVWACSHWRRADVPARSSFPVQIGMVY